MKNLILILALLSVAGCKFSGETDADVSNKDAAPAVSPKQPEVARPVDPIDEPVPDEFAQPSATPEPVVEPSATPVVSATPSPTPDQGGGIIVVTPTPTPVTTPVATPTPSPTPTPIVVTVHKMTRVDFSATFNTNVTSIGYVADYNGKTYIWDNGVHLKFTYWGFGTLISSECWGTCTTSDFVASPRDFYTPRASANNYSIEQLRTYPYTDSGMDPYNHIVNEVNRILADGEASDVNCQMVDQDGAQVLDCGTFRIFEL